MRFNSGRPIKALTAKEQDGLLEMLFPAKQPEVFTRNRTVDSLRGFLPWNTDTKPRKLNTHEKNIAGGFFGDMIDLEEVRIDDKSWLAFILYLFGRVMTEGNTIYGINIPDDTLIHELVHVWQYDKDIIDFDTAAKKHREAWEADQTAELYLYSVDDSEDENRRTFRDYGFEEQASIVQDAYLVIEEKKPPKRNKDYKGGTPVAEDTELLALYEGFMEEFGQWHEELTE